MKVIIILLFVLVSESLLASSLVCSIVFRAENLKTSGLSITSELNPTYQLKSYFVNLLSERILSLEDLQRLAEGLEHGQLINPVQHELTAQGPVFLKASYQIHFEAIDEFIRNKKIDIQSLAEWVSDQLKETDRVKQKRDETNVQTKVNFQIIDFNYVPGGSYIKVESVKKRKVKIEPFEMMSTLITQRQWVEIMGENPSKFVDGPYTIEIAINGQNIRLQPDNPVERVGLDGIEKFIQKINELSRAGDPILKKLILDFKKGDIYRLPTEEEWEYVARDLGTVEEIRKFGKTFSELDEYAWFDKNSSNQTQPVAQLKPEIVDGKKYYDLHGNVTELNSNVYKKSTVNSHLKGKDAKELIVWGRGGSFSSQGPYLLTRLYQGVSDKFETTGFRLVREVR